MIHLPKSLAAWDTPDFNNALGREIEQLKAGQLPLQQCLSTGSHALDGGLHAMILNVTDEGAVIRARTGIFFASIIGGCSCADDPTPIDENNEYCELQFDIDKSTGLATVTVAN